MASTQVKTLVNLYKSAAAIPSIKSARILGLSFADIIIQCIWTQKNLERKITQYFLQNYNLTTHGTGLMLSGFPVDVTAELMSAMTEDDEHRAVLRQVTIDNSTKQYIEIWDNEHMVKNYDLSALDVHGDVYTDNEFSSFEWSPDNTKLLYIAEKKLPKSEPFYKQKSLDKKDKEKKEDEIVGDEYIYKPHWGEQLVGKHQPVVVVLDTTKQDDIKVLSGIPDELSPGQVIWTKDQDIIGVAWKHEPRYLGLVACTNRTSWIFLLKDGKYQKLSDDGCAVHSPRISPKGNYLVWLEREAGGPHHNAHRLMLRNLKSTEQKNDIVVDIVQRSKTINKNVQFYGIYGRLCRRCWFSEEYLILSTPQKNRILSYVIDIKTKGITEILPTFEGSLVVLDVKCGMIAFLNSSLMQSPNLNVACDFVIDIAIPIDCLRLTPINTNVKIHAFKEIMCEYNEYTYDNNDEIKQFNFIYFGPKQGKDASIPLIVIPHGGPHSNYVDVYSFDFSIFVSAGFAIVLVNYRGSTGMGSATVEYLLGRVGDVDVKDCLTATEEAFKKYPWLNPDKVGLCGGSHGGFLVTHLSGYAPDVYKAVVARNPVIDIAVMFSTSDIPDCRNALTKEEKIAYLHDVCAAETGFPYVSESHDRPDNIDMYVKMLKCSPIVNVDKVKAPTLICIGMNDLRVPPTQGKTWYHRLKANNVITKMLVYEDNHPLSSGPVEIDNILNDCLWFQQYLDVTNDIEVEKKE